MKLELNFTDEEIKPIQDLCDKMGLTLENYCKVSVIKRAAEDKVRL